MARKIRNGIWTWLVVTSMVGISFAQTQNIPDCKNMMDSTLKVQADYIKIPVILFNFDSHRLNIGANPMDSIRLIANFLKMNKNLVVEISNHTDYRSDNPKLATRLSESRARIIVDSLVALGVERERLIAVGYQSHKPVTLCSDISLPSGKTVKKGAILSKTWIEKYYPSSKNKDDYEALMAMNRRTEMKILRTNFEK